MQDTNTGMTKDVSFTASILNCCIENDVVIISMGNDPISPDRYVILSRFDDGQVDDSIGIQTYMSEIEVANAVEHIVLKKNSCTLRIKKTKEDAVGSRKIIINFENCDMGLLVTYLDKVFRDSSVNLSIDC